MDFEFIKKCNDMIQSNEDCKQEQKERKKSQREIFMLKKKEIKRNRYT